MTYVHVGGPHLDGADLLAAAVDELLEAPRQRQEAVAVQEALVPGVEPAACAIVNSLPHCARNSSITLTDEVPKLPGRL